MDILVDNCQSTFVPGRVISDNIILSHELVKGYGRRDISPRCMVKVDMQKAYDSLEWNFIEQILEFSKASGLVANKEKSSVYFGGVDMATQQAILDLLEFFKGRVQLIKNVLFSIQVFWSQVFVLTKKVIKLIEATCRKFLWTGGVELTKKALLAWEKICYPNVAGGLNILDITVWNMASISKLLWNLCCKKDKMWVKWVHSYYIKEQQIWEIMPTQVSWVVQKIPKIRSYVQKAGIMEADLRNTTQFSVKKMCILMRGDFPKVQWRKIVCNNLGSEKWIFILRLAAHGKLATKDRLMKWGVISGQECPLCLTQNESINHIFFQCDMSIQVWCKLLQWQGINRAAMPWLEELKWAEDYARGRSATAEIYRMTLASGVYHLWIERNQRRELGSFRWLVVLDVIVG
ncbi:uncharacterized protein [Nicotiana tomentosiformis]|uniref:uncharacterized protein n=1 Tax=Nicotiana tomentosiformis TaxID=4098 RepID=UPI00388C4FC5